MILFFGRGGRKRSCRLQFVLSVSVSSPAVAKDINNGRQYTYCCAAAAAAAGVAADDPNASLGRN